MPYMLWYLNIQTGFLLRFYYHSNIAPCSSNALEGEWLGFLVCEAFWTHLKILAGHEFTGWCMSGIVRLQSRKSMKMGQTCGWSKKNMHHNHVSHCFNKCFPMGSLLLPKAVKALANLYIPCLVTYRAPLSLVAAEEAFVALVLGIQFNQFG